jgi:hypothetical protein
MRRRFGKCPVLRHRVRVVSAKAAKPCCPVCAESPCTLAVTKPELRNVQATWLDGHAGWESPTSETNALLARLQAQEGEQ